MSLHLQSRHELDRREQAFRLVAQAAIRARIPVGYNFPVGHGPQNRPVPLGLNVHFNSDTGTLTYLESPFRNAQRKKSVQLA